MSIVGTIISWVAGQRLKASALNQNFTDMKVSINAAYTLLGDLTTLATTEKDEIVGAINEIANNYIKPDGSVDYTAVQSYPKLTITGITKANPAVVTFSETPNLSNNDKIAIASIVGMTEVNGQSYTVANVNNTNKTVELSGIDSSGYTTYTSGGYAYLLPKNNENLANKKYVDDGLALKLNSSDFAQPGYVPYSVNSGLTSINKVSDTEVSFTIASGGMVCTFPSGETTRFKLLI
jgi:hypothetical protein